MRNGDSADQDNSDDVKAGDYKVDDLAGDGDGDDNGNDDKAGDYKVDDPTASCLGPASGLIFISTPVRGESFGSK